jgi:hypothetical protein
MEKVVVGGVRFVTDEHDLVNYYLDMMRDGEKVLIEKHALRPWVEVEDGDEDGEYIERYVFVAREMAE